MIKPRTRNRGFTLVELLVVIAIIGVLSAILLPALAKSKARAQAVFCLNNTKQLAVALVLYADDHNGRLAYNLGSSIATPVLLGLVPTVPMNVNWADNVLDWELSPDNTNAAKMIASGIGPYVSGSATSYRCPSDFVLSQRQRDARWTARVRSYSMNAMIGDAGSFSQSGVNQNNPDYVQFFKLSTLTRPASIFVFLDEHPDSIDDGYFLNRAGRHEWNDLPASYHNRAASFSFADGHSEIHRWRNASTMPPSQPDVAVFPIQIPANAPGDLRDYYWVISAMSVERYPEPNHP